MKIASTTSSQDIRKEKIAAAKRPWLMAGSVTRSFASRGVAPHRIAASSIDLSKPSSALVIEMIAKGSATTGVGDDEADEGAVQPELQEEGVERHGKHDDRQDHRRQEQRAQRLAPAKAAARQAEARRASPSSDREDRHHERRS